MLGFFRATLHLDQRLDGLDVVMVCHGSQRAVATALVVCFWGV